MIGRIRTAWKLTALLLALTGHIDHAPIRESRVDWLELNHYYDSRGCLNFSQFIGWDFCDLSCGFHAQWWIIPQRDVYPVRTPHGWEVVVTKCDKVYRLAAGSFSETWTQWDREVLDRDAFPVEWRKGLP